MDEYLLVKISCSWLSTFALTLSASVRWHALINSYCSGGGFNWPTDTSTEVRLTHFFFSCHTFMQLSFSEATLGHINTQLTCVFECVKLILSGFDFNPISVLIRLSSNMSNILTVGGNMAHTQLFVWQKMSKQWTFVLLIPVLSVQKKTDISAATCRVTKKEPLNTNSLRCMLSWPNCGGETQSSTAHLQAEKATKKTSDQPKS